MGAAGLVQAYVGLNHVRNDPGAGLSGTRRLGTGLNDTGEIVIDPNLAVRIGAKPLQCLAKRPVYAKLCDLEHHARVGRPPQNGLAFGVPRKNTGAVGRAEVFDRK